MHPNPPKGVDAHLWGLAAAAEPDYASALSYGETTLAPPAATLMAFTAELRSIPARVTEPMLGAIRLQWWREALEEAFSDGDVRAHPLVTALRQEAPHLVPLRAELDAMIDETAAFLEPEERVGFAPAIASARVHDGRLAALIGRLIDPGAGHDALKTLGSYYGAARQSQRPMLLATGSVELPENRIRRQLDAAIPKLAAHFSAAWREAAPFEKPMAPVFAAVGMAPHYLRAAAPSPLRLKAAQFLMVLRGK